MKALIFNHQEACLVILFLAIRVLSFITYHLSFINSAICIILIISFLIITLKKISLAWLALIAELLLDGVGHFFEFQGLILRTWFLGIFGICWLWHIYKTKKFGFGLNKTSKIVLTLVLGYILFSTLRGIIFDHGFRLVLQDAILYFFLLLLFPALEYKEKLKKYLPLILKVFIIGSAIFSVSTFIIYSSGLGILQDSYYHWFRDIAGGKITDLGFNFFRIVLADQLFIVPLILILASLLIKQTKKLYWFLITSLVLILSLNFTRIYFIALIFGLFCLLYKNSFKQWLKVSTTIILLMILIFSGISFLASQGQSFGLEIWGLKTSQISSPASDLSGAIRLAMLPDIFKTIKVHPLLGSGLATQISYTDPLTHQLVSRTQFDWGYLEMLAELGVLGTLIYLSFIIYHLYLLFKQSNLTNDSGLAQGILVGAISLFVINLTTPALFQGFGVLYILLLVMLISNEVPACNAMRSIAGRRDPF